MKKIKESELDPNSRDRLTKEIMQATSPPPEHLGKDKRSLREWWQSILRKHGKYACFAVFLILPGDIAAIQYLIKNNTELDQITGGECMVLVFTDRGFGEIDLIDEIWSRRIANYVAKGFSAKLAKWFKVRYDEMPSMILFRDIRQGDHLKINLNGLDTKEITHLLRSIFSVVSGAIAKGEDPLLVIERQRKNDEFKVKGVQVVGAIKKIAEKTLEKALELVIKSWAGPITY